MNRDSWCQEVRQDELTVEFPQVATVLLTWAKLDLDLDLDLDLARNMTGPLWW